jgi:glycosyltransferase involved in cell wall biosynthesis
MAALRILHVAPYFEDAWAYGGIPRVVAAQAHALAAAGHRVTVATTDVRDAATRTRPAGGAALTRFAHRVERTADGIDVRVFPNLSNTAAYRWQLYLPLGFARDCRAGAREFDVAHLHACHNLLTAVAARHLCRAGVPYVVQPNGTARRIERRLAVKLIFDALFERGVLAAAARIVAVTACEQRQLEHDLGREGASKVHVVPNPLAPMPPRPSPERGAFRRRYELTRAPVLMFLGVLSPRKQPQVLARAAAEMSRKDVQLVFAGNDMGAERRTRDAVRRFGLDARTRFTGLLTGTLRYDALADADIVVYPSHDEVFGLVPLEALQSGTPVIVSDDSGCGEIIRAVGGGLLVPPGEPRAMAAAIDAVLGDLPRWRAEAARAGAEASRRFHPDLVASRLEEIYREAVART